MYVLTDVLLTSSSDMEGYLDVAQQWGQFFANIYVHPIIFVTCVSILAGIFLFRYFLIVSYDEEKAKQMNVLKQYKQYVAGHMLLQLLIAFFFAYIVIKFTRALIDSYIINCIISEVIGLTASILIDSKFIVPAEEKHGLFNNPLCPAGSSKNEDSAETGTVSGNSNTININIGHNSAKEEIIDGQAPLFEEDAIEMEQLVTIDERPDAMMKSIIDMQEKQAKMIEDLSVSVIGIRDTMMTNLRFELHDDMMNDIIQGYTTQDNYDRISTKYHDYRISLKGNHGIEKLFEKYDKLDVREDRQQRKKIRDV